MISQVKLWGLTDGFQTHPHHLCQLRPGVESARTLAMLSVQLQGLVRPDISTLTMFFHVGPGFLGNLDLNRPVFFLPGHVEQLDVGASQHWSTFKP